MVPFLCSLLQDLYEKLAKKRYELEHDRSVVSSRMIFREWVSQCIETYKTNLADSTKLRFEQRVRHSILPEIGDMLLQAIKPIHIQQTMNKQSGKSKTQVNEIYYALRFFFRHAYENHLIKEDPTEHLVKPKRKASSHRRALTAKERETVLTIAKTDRRYYLYLLMLLCGCRPSEAAEAMGKDIVQLEGVWMLHIRGTKTASSDRYVPIPLQLYSLIKDTPKLEYIVQNSNDKKINQDARRKIWKSFKRQLNIAMGCKVYRNQLLPPYPLAPDLVPYCFRHEYCTNLARNGIDIRVAQKLMGHASIQMTANIYTNLNNSDIVEVAHILDGSHQGSHH